MNAAVQIVALVLGLIEFVLRFVLVLVTCVLVFPMIILLESGNDMPGLIVPFLWKQALR